MKKQLRQRLRLETNAEMTDSIIYNPDHSLIHDLQDLLQKQQQSNDKNIFTSRKIYQNPKNGSPSPRSYNLAKNLSAKIDVFRDNGDNLFSKHRSRNKIDFQRLNQQLSHCQTQRTNLRLNIFDQEQKQRKRFHKQPSYFQGKKQTENTTLRNKFDYNRSGIVKNKELIYKNILDKCQNCGQIRSAVFRGNLVCKNRNCRLLHFYQDFQTFPLGSILYDIETPSSTSEQLEELIKKIREEIKRIQDWRDSLIELQFQVQSIIESRRQFQKHNKNELKNFLSSLTDLKCKKLKENQIEIRSLLQQKLQKIDLRQPYQQFNRWRKIDIEKFISTKTISDMILKCKPLCLKKLSSDIAESAAEISDNFSNLSVLINASEFISYNFVGNLSKLVLIIDGSMQFKRDNFLCIENLDELKLIFNCRKTSRELRELFNILPNPNSLIFSFDYKTNSHLSSEAFPLITEAFQSAKKSLIVNLHNARLQVFEDLLQASKIKKPKQSVELSIDLNPFISEAEWPDHTKSSQWGTKVMKSFIENMGNKAIKIQFNIPLLVNMEQISELLINSDYYLLTILKINSRICWKDNKPNEVSMVTLLQKMTNKKKLLLAHLLNQRRHSSHALNISRGLAETVYQSLF